MSWFGDSGFRRIGVRHGPSPALRKTTPATSVTPTPSPYCQHLYKIFSGTLSQRLTAIASEFDWLSPEQKEFLPSVCGIYEHFGLLQTAVEEARAERRQLSIALLDLCKGLGSLPHSVSGGGLPHCPFR